MKKVTLLCILAVVVCSCGENKTNTPSEAKKTRATSSLPVSEQQVFCLSMISNIPAAAYSGYTLGGIVIPSDSQKAVSNIVGYATPIMDATLQQATDTTNNQSLSLSVWHRVWGPAVAVKPTVMFINYSYPYVSSSSMTIFKDTGNNYVVAIQATNPNCPYDWDTLDMTVGTLMPWTTLVDTAQNAGNISYGTYRGLEDLFGLVDNTNKYPGAVQYLDSVIADSTATKIANIVVTGHSLGGALAPVFALYMQNQASKLNKSTSASVYCLSTAGATAGDFSFANYYNTALQANTEKIWNFLDVVPRAWDTTTLSQIKSVNGAGGLYSQSYPSVLHDSTFTCTNTFTAPPPFIPMPTPTDINYVINKAIAASDTPAHTFTQICNGGSSFNNQLYINVSPNFDEDYMLSVMGLFNQKGDTAFLAELGAQHVPAYAIYYNITMISQFMRNKFQTYPLNAECGSVIGIKCARKAIIPTKGKNQKPPAFDPMHVFFALINSYAWR